MHAHTPSGDQASNSCRAGDDAWQATEVQLHCHGLGLILVYHEYVIAVGIGHCEGATQGVLR